MFTTYPTYPRYRTLQLTTPHQKGEDVYALQVGLIETGFPLPLYGADGDLGSETSAAILLAQKSSSGLVADGLAGGKTQQAIAMRLANTATFQLGVTPGALQGQLEHESGFRLGNYSPLHSDGVTYDAGVAQRNTEFTDVQLAFDPDASIRALAGVIKSYYALFKGVPTGRRWRLAQGAWNAPAFACWIAREEGATQVTSSQCAHPSTVARATLEAYIVSVSAYLTV